MSTTETTFIQHNGRTSAAFSAVRVNYVPVTAGFSTPIGQRVLRT